MKISQVKTLSQLRKLIKTRKRAAKQGSKLYGKLNKSYKKVDWKRQYIPTTEAKEILDDPFLKCWRRLYTDKEIKPIKNDKNLSNVVYKTENIEGLCLIKELASLLEVKYLQKIPKYVKQQGVPFYFDSAYRGRVFLFSYPKSKEWKAELLTQFLKTKEFLFDEDSPHWKGMKKVRYFCQKFLMNCKVERWQSQVQRFLSEKD